MMSRRLGFTLILMMIASVISCGGKEIIRHDFSGTYNLVITLYDRDIDNPENDRRSYYEVYIDKTESGRTTIGLESQKKVFEAKLTSDRHLIKVEKWILDESQGRYIKLNNLYQPKPDFIYVDIEDGKTTRVNVESSRYGTSLYTIVKE